MFHPALNLNAQRVTRRTFLGRCLQRTGRRRPRRLYWPRRLARCSDASQARRPRTTPQPRTVAAGSAPSRRQSQTRRRPLARRRPVACRSVRRQARSCARWRAKTFPIRFAARRDCRRCRAATANGRPTRDQTVTKLRPVRHRAQRDAAQHRRARRRDLPRPQHAHRGRQSRARRDPLHDRLASPRPAQHGRLADLRTRQRNG